MLVGKYIRDEYKKLTQEEKDKYYEQVKYFYIDCRYCERNISSIIGCTRNTVHQIIKDYGIEKTEEQRKADRSAKYHKTCIEKYGVPCHLLNENIKEQIKNTVQERYGVDTIMKSDIVKKKCRKTNKERYGFECSLQNKDVRNKCIETCRKNYGVDYYVQTQESQKHINDVLKSKYGANSISQLHIPKDKLEILNDKDKFVSFLDSIPKKSMKKSEICETLGIGLAQFNVRLRKWNLNNYHFHRNESKYEIEVAKILDSWNVKYYRNYRKLIRNPDTNLPLEVDFYLYEKSVAIEFNGIVWHDKLNPVRENKKTSLCADLGVKLIHIWEDDWNLDKDSIISNLKDLIFNYVSINSIEILDLDNDIPVYDIEVPNYNNFVLANDLVVHNSFDSRQQFEVMGFNDSKIVSLDKTPDGYLVFKSAIYEHRMSLIQLDILEKEIIQLERNNMSGKVDHPVDGSKDVVDGLAGALYNASLHKDTLGFDIIEDNNMILSINTEDEIDDRQMLLNSLLAQSESNSEQTMDSVQNNDIHSYVNSMLDDVVADVHKSLNVENKIDDIDDTANVVNVKEKSENDALLDRQRYLEAKRRQMGYTDGTFANVGNQLSLNDLEDGLFIF